MITLDEKVIVQQIEQLEQNPEFIEKVRKVGSAEELRELLTNEGIEVEAEALDSIIFKVKPDGELDEKALEDVAGGMIVGPSWWLIKLWKDTHRGSTVHTSSSGSSHGGTGGRTF